MNKILNLKLSNESKAIAHFLQLRKYLNLLIKKSDNPPDESLMVTFVTQSITSECDNFLNKISDLRTDAEDKGVPLTWDKLLKSLETKANVKHQAPKEGTSSSKRNANHTDGKRRGGRGGGRGSGNTGRGNPRAGRGNDGTEPAAWRTDDTLHVPKKHWEKLQPEEKKRRGEAQRKAKAEKAAREQRTAAAAAAAASQVQPGDDVSVITTQTGGLQLVPVQVNQLQQVPAQSAQQGTVMNAQQSRIPGAPNTATGSVYRATRTNSSSSNSVTSGSIPGAINVAQAQPQSLVQDQNGNFYYVSRQANMVAAKRQKTLHPHSTPSLLNAKLSVHPLPDPSIVGGEVVDNNSGPLVNRDEEEVEQNVSEPVEGNDAGIIAAEAVEEAHSPDPRFVGGVLELLDPIGLGFHTDRVLNGKYENSFDITFRMVIRIDDPNAKEPDLQDYSLPTMSVRAGLPTPGFHDRAEWYQAKEMTIPMHEFQSFRQPLIVAMLTFGVLPQECAVMLVVNHLPFIKSTTISSPEAASVLTFHPVSPYDSPRDLDFIREHDPDRSIWTGRLSELYNTSIDIFVYPPKAHLLGTFNPGRALVDPTDPSGDPHVLNEGGRAPHFLADPASAVLSYLVQRSVGMQGHEYHEDITNFDKVDRFGVSEAGLFAGSDQLHTFVDRCSGFLSDPALSAGITNRGIPNLNVSGSKYCSALVSWFCRRCPHIPMKLGENPCDGVIPVDKRWGLHQYAWMYDNDMVREIMLLIVADCLEIDYGHLDALRCSGASDVKDYVLARMAVHNATDWDFFDDWRPRRWTQHKAIVPDRIIQKLARDAMSGAQGGQTLPWTTYLDQCIERKLSQFLQATGERFDTVSSSLRVRGLPADLHRHDDFEFRYLWAERDGEPIAGMEEGQPDFSQRFFIERSEYWSEHRPIPDTDMFARPAFPGREFPAQEPGLHIVLPNAVYRDVNNAERVVQARFLHLTKATSTGMTLIDRGANVSLANVGASGPFVVLGTIDGAPRVDVTGIGDSSALTSLQQLVVATVATNPGSNGRRHLLIIYGAIAYDGCKNILSAAQLEHSGNTVHDKLYVLGGKQKMITHDNIVFKFCSKDALCYMRCEKPTQEDLDSARRTNLTNPAALFDPSVLHGSHDEDQWLEQSDEEDLDDYEHHETMNNFYLDAYENQFTDGDSQHFTVGSRYAFATQTLSAYAAISERTAALTTKRNAIDPADYKDKFLWKNDEVIRQTFKNSTIIDGTIREVRTPQMQNTIKARNPVLQAGKIEPCATDTIYPSHDCPAHDGSTMAQLYVGLDSLHCCVYGMQSESSFVKTLSDFIRYNGVMRMLRSDNAQVVTSNAAQNVMRQWAIPHGRSEPHQQRQNPAERQVQEVKAATRTLMDRSGCPKWAWLLAMTCACFVLNHTCRRSLGWKAPHTVRTGQENDLSLVLRFTFWEEVFVYDSEASFPDSREVLAHYCHPSPNVGNEYCATVYRPDTDEVIERSMLRPANNPVHPNLRALPPQGEGVDDATTMSTQDNVDDRDDPVDDSFALYSRATGENRFDHPIIDGNVEPEMPTPTLDIADHLMDVLGKTFLMDRDENGDLHRAEVLRRADDLDNDLDSYVVKIGEKYEDIMTYDAIVQKINDQLEREASQTDEERVWIFKEVLDHRRQRGRTEVLMKWEDDSQTWEPLDAIWRDDPIYLAQYAQDNDLLNTPGWKRLRTYVKNPKKAKRLAMQAKRRTKRSGQRIKYGVKVPRNHAEAMKFEEKWSEKRWTAAVRKEFDEIYNFNSFKSLGLASETPIPQGFTKIKCHLVFDVKEDGRLKARFVAGGHMTGDNPDTYYSSVVSLRSVRTVVFLAELNGLQLMAGDVGNAYLMATTDEKVVFEGGPELEHYGHNGHLLQIVRCQYGLKTSGARWHGYFAATMSRMGYFASKADPDIWMKDCGDHYSYVAVYVDDCLYAGKDGKAFFDELKSLGFKLKGCDEPDFFLGGNFGRADKDEPEGTVRTWGARRYVDRLMQSYRGMFGEDPKKRAIYAPLDESCHPELDDSPLCNEEDKRKYWQMIGELQWAVSLGRIDIMNAVISLGTFRPAPRVGHLELAKRVYSYLRNRKNSAIKFNVDLPDYSSFEVVDGNWGSQYGDCSEAVPHDAPVPKGNPVLLTTFVDANLMADVTTGRSRTGIIHLYNGTPMDWYCKNQNRVEGATYGSEFQAAKTAVEQIVDHRTTLRYLGVPLGVVNGSDASWMFGDNLSVVNSTVMPNGKLQKRSHLLNYHMCREAQAAGIINFAHIDGKDNPADVLTKNRSSKEWFALLKPLIFWRSDSKNADGTHDGSHIVEGSDIQSPTAAPSSGVGYKRLRFYQMFPRRT